jgi:PAS domain S-box-containing protein
MRPRVIALNPFARYGIAIVVVVIAAALRVALNPVWGIGLPYITFYPGVMLVAWLGGLGPGIAATVLSALLADYLWIPPAFTLAIADVADTLGLVVFTAMGFVISLLNEAWRRSTRRVAGSEERLRVTLASIGDAVLATDEQGRITQLNPVGERLTGWREADAIGRAIQDVFVILNEQTRQPAPHPVERVLREGVVAGLANHTVLVSKAGDEIPIDDSAAPVRAEDGQLRGAVMVFRDITERRQMERERAARARVARELAAIVESSDDAIVSKDLDGVITAWNGAAERMYGYTAQEAIGRSIRLIVPDDVASEEDEVLRRIRAGERAEHFETRRRRKDGTTVHVSVTVSPIRDDSGAVIGASKTARDVTTRKQIERERAALLESERAARQDLEVAVQQLQTALHAGRMGMWEYARGTGTVTWSPGLEAIHGYAPGTFPGTFEAFRKEIHPEDRERVLQAIADAAAQRRPHHIEYRIIRADGAIRWVEGRGQLFGDGSQQTDRMVGVCADITERKQIETQHAELLERELHARTDLERASRMKDEFLAVLSHELRTPLNAVLGYAHLLASGSLPATRSDHAIAAIRRNAQAQARLVESLLDLSRVMAGKLELNQDRVDLSSVVDAAVDVVRTDAEAKEITLQVRAASEPPVVIGDASRLQQVFWNLLSNAVKFTPRGGHIDMSLQAQGRHVTVTVTDDGGGINSDLLPFVFDRFKQGDTDKGRPLSGLGLGLALVRELVHAHGGTVLAASPGDGGGSTFTVTLPKAQIGSDTATESHVPSLQILPPFDVLVVDDDGEVRDLLALLLEVRGARVRAVSSAAEVLAAVRANPPDVLLADLRMPLQDGYSLIRTIRAEERERRSGRRLAAIAVSADATTTDRERAMAAGYDGHVGKPIDPDTLVQAIVTVARADTA